MSRSAAFSMRQLIRPRLILLMRLRGLGWRRCGGPLGLEDPGVVDALVRMRAEEIALGLNEIGGEAFAWVGVVVGQRSAERRRRDAILNRRRDHPPPRVL